MSFGQLYFEVLSPLLVWLSLLAFQFHWNWSTFPLQQYQSLKLRCVSRRQQADGFCFIIYSASRFLLVGELDHLYLKLLLKCVCYFWSLYCRFLAPLFMFSVVLCVLIVMASYCCPWSLCSAHSSLQPEILLLHILQLWLSKYFFSKLFRSWKVFLSPSIMADNFAWYSSLGWPSEIQDSECIAPGFSGFQSFH